MKKTRLTPSEPFTPPSLTVFLKHKYWGIHEAAFVLTNWPNKDLFECYITPLSEDVKEDRSFFYMLPHDRSFDPYMFGKEYQRVFCDIKTSIENKTLPARFEYLFDGVSYLVSPQDLIVWALLRGRVLPEILQKELRIYQIKKKSTKPLQKNVKKKILAQFCLSKNQAMSMEELCREVKYLDDSENSDYTASRRVINELFDSQGVRGRPSIGEKKPRKYTPKPILEVVEFSSDGLIHYQFPLLKDAMLLAAQIKLQIISEDQPLKITKEEFLDKFMNDDVVNLYIKNAPELIVNLVRRFGEQALIDYESFQSQLAFIQKFLDSPNQSLKIKNGRFIDDDG